MDAMISSGGANVHAKGLAAIGAMSFKSACFSFNESVSTVAIDMQY